MPVTGGTTMRAAAATLLFLVLLSTNASAQWEFRYDTEGNLIHVIVADEVHGRVYAGTNFGVAYLDVLSDQWTSVAIPGEDDGISAIGWQPGHDQRLILGRMSGDIQRSDDLGASVVLVYDGLPGTVITGIERDPTEPDRFYACTKTSGAMNAGKVLRGGLGGLVWTELLDDAVHDFYGLTVDAAGTVYVGGPGGILRSSDAGLSWEPANNGLPASDVLCLAAVQSGPPGRIYAGNSVDLYASDNGGDTWQPIGWGHKCQQVAVHPSYPGILAAHLSWGVGPPDYVLVTYNAGASWDTTGYDWIAGDWSSLSALDISGSDHTIYGDNFQEI